MRKVFLILLLLLTASCAYYPYADGYGYYLYAPYYGGYGYGYPAIGLYGGGYGYRGGTVTMADIEVVMAVAIMAAGMAAFAVVVDKIQIVRDRQFNRNFGDFAFVE
jgi:hypothetical protein